jgi:hypothetical protein
VVVGVYGSLASNNIQYYKKEYASDFLKITLKRKKFSGFPVFTMGFL